MLIDTYINKHKGTSIFIINQ